MSPDAPRFGPHGVEAGSAPTGDAAVDALVSREVGRRRDTLQLLASETDPTPGVRAAMASVFDAKYAEGYPGARYHGGCDVADELEELAWKDILVLRYSAPPEEDAPPSPSA